MNSAISIVLPMPTLIVQFPVGYEQYPEVTFQCAHCGQHTVNQTNEKKEEIIQPKDEKQEIKQANIGDKVELKEELMCGYSGNNSILHNNPNFYSDEYSLISSVNSEHSENDNVFPVGQHGEISDDCYENCLKEIMELVTYLKEDVYDN